MKESPDRPSPIRAPRQTPIPGTIEQLDVWSTIEPSKTPIITMKQTSYLTTTIQPGNRLEIDLPNFPIGQTVEVIIITEMPNPEAQMLNRSQFLKLPIADRRRILEQQAEAALPHYQQDTEWQEWVNLDIAETNA
jgi:hypothetical protein